MVKTNPAKPNTNSINMIGKNSVPSILYSLHTLRWVLVSFTMHVRVISLLLKALNISLLGSLLCAQHLKT